MRRAVRLTKKDYRHHLTSSEWAETRRLAFERSGGLCEGCRRAKATQVHHLTYQHVGAELLFELVALCGDCHRRAEAPGMPAGSAPRSAPPVSEQAQPVELPAIVVSRSLTTSEQEALTWENLCRLEPALIDLEAEAHAVAAAAGERFCAANAWYPKWHGRTCEPRLKGQLVALVGAGRDQERGRQRLGGLGYLLESSEAYDLAYAHLYALLPDCRGECFCVPPGLAAQTLEQRIAQLDAP